MVGSVFAEALRLISVEMKPALSVILGHFGKKFFLIALYLLFVDKELPNK